MTEPGYYDFLEFNSPLSSARADSIARSLVRRAPETVVDLGCGWGELLLSIVAAGPGSRGIGVDSDERLIARASNNARVRGLSDRVEFRVGDLVDASDPADVVVCIGADHAFGSQAEALRQLRPRVGPGGRLLFGSGFWERPPTEEQAATIGMTPASLTGLEGLVEMSVASGFRPLGIQTANRDEWDAFESGFLADWEEWLVDNADDPEADAIRTSSNAHRDGWLRGYRDVLGFAYLTLAQAG